jgi:hypothetical protein
VLAVWLRALLFLRVPADLELPVEREEPYRSCPVLSAPWQRRLSRQCCVILPARRRQLVDWRLDAILPMTERVEREFYPARNGPMR